MPGLIIVAAVGSDTFAAPETPNNVADAFSLPACLIITPGTNPDTAWNPVPPIPIVAFLDKNLTEFDGKLSIKLLATEILGLKKRAVPGLPTLNLALRRTNFISSN